MEPPQSAKTKGSSSPNRYSESSLRFSRGIWFSRLWYVKQSRMIEYIFLFYDIRQHFWNDSLSLLFHLDPEPPLRFLFLKQKLPNYNNNTLIYIIDNELHMTVKNFWFAYFVWYQNVIKRNILNKIIN